MIMQRNKVDHVLRAAASITGHKAFVLIGSAALIARIKGPTPAGMLMTQEVDIYASDVDNVEELSDMIDGSIGQNSPFHTSFGFYADGVSPETAKMPSDWMDRATKYSSPACEGVTAIVPDENDLALAKLVAWREKDIDWLRAGVVHRILSLDVMESRLDRMPPGDPASGNPGIKELRERMLILRAHTRMD
jgi:hypothetical protein